MKATRKIQPTTAIRPATPLPFRAGTSGAHGLHKILDADGRVVGEASSYSVHCFPQRDYLIHAANNYPRLVAMVREFDVAAARALLSELGEA